MPAIRITRVFRLAPLLWAAVGGGLCGWEGFVGPAPARGDILVLRSGGQIEGEILNFENAAKEGYSVRTATGGQLNLRPEQVLRVIRKSDAERAYERFLPRMPATADGNWLMAEWLRKNGLNDLREKHLRQALTHDPDFEQARYALGFTRIEGRWVKPDEFMEKAGYVKFGGSWRLPQEMEMAATDKRLEDQQVLWAKNLRMWRSWLLGRSAQRAVQARAEFARLTDPLAVPELIRLLEGEDEIPEIKRIYIDALARINTPAAENALATAGLEDESSVVRGAAWEALGEGHRPALTRRLIRELQGKDNKRVNRAAYGLSFVGDESAILPLIDALVTRHKFIINQGQGNMGATFGSGPNSGGGTFSAGGGPKLVEQDLTNRHVLNALVALTKEPVNFQYHEDRWRQWYIDTHTPPDVDLRRGP